MSEAPKYQCSDDPLDLPICDPCDDRYYSPTYVFKITFEQIRKLHGCNLQEAMNARVDTFCEPGFIGITIYKTENGEQIGYRELLPLSECEQQVKYL